MSKSIKRFEILLDNPTATFAPGDVVSGKLFIQLDHAKSLRVLKLRFKGSCEVHWVEPKEAEVIGGGAHYDADEIYFREDICLFGSEVGGTTEMAAGLHTFPFSYNLPHNIPSSFLHEIGSVQYSVKAIFDRPWKSKHVIHEPFTIRTPLDLNSTDLGPNIGIDDESLANFQFLCLPCISQGNMALKINVPTTFFTYNDEIGATVNILNNSDSVSITKVKMILRQEFTFHNKIISMRKKRGNKIKKKRYDVESTEKLGPFSKESDVKLSLRVPRLSLSFLKYCSLIDINYRLIISVHVSGWHSAIQKIFDVLIGSSRPLSTMSTEQSSIPYPMPNYSAPSVPSIMPVENSHKFNPEFPAPSTSGFPHSHQESSRNIGFVYPQPTSPYENSIKPLPSSYISTMVNMKQ